jgi:hypothetical protein
MVRRNGPFRREGDVTRSFFRHLLGSVGALLLSAAPFALAESPSPPTSSRADVERVAVTGSAGSYLFRVTVRSPDRGCGQYANWWEVVTDEGELVYRRVLKHSHTNEQPFTRSGGPVPVAADQVVIVRAHMEPGGYGGTAYKGTAASGFRVARLAEGFAAGLARKAPLPESCAH